jgi:hypothetical protein
MHAEKLLKLLKENRVKFAIIGATAFPVICDLGVLCGRKSKKAVAERLGIN